MRQRYDKKRMAPFGNQQNVFMENLPKKHRERMGYVDSADQDQPQQKKRRKHGLWFF